MCSRARDLPDTINKPENPIEMRELANQERSGGGRQAGRRRGACDNANKKKRSSNKTYCMTRALQVSAIFQIYTCCVCVCIYRWHFGFATGNSFRKCISFRSMEALARCHLLSKSLPVAICCAVLSCILFRSPWPPLPLQCGR